MGRAMTDEQNITLGDDLLLIVRGDSSYELYSFDGRDARLLGTYPDAAAAWRAIDAIDGDESEPRLSLAA
jgi:hypothetical protein